MCNAKLLVPSTSRRNPDRFACCAARAAARLPSVVESGLASAVVTGLGASSLGGSVVHPAPNKVSATSATTASEYHAQRSSRTACVCDSPPIINVQCRFIPPPHAGTHD